MVWGRFAGAVTSLVVMGAVIPTSSALEPPTREQIERYRRDGTLAERAVAARKFDNYRVVPELVQRLVGRAESVKNIEISKVLPATGNRRVFVLLIDFEDHRGRNSRSDFDRRLFGPGLTSERPYESLREYYQRSSYGQLDIDGTTFAWYTYPHSRDRIEETTAGREGLIQRAIDYIDGRGHDFSRYDSNSDGVIDYFLVFWAGPHQEWAEFWWGYQRTFENDNYTVDGKRLGSYSWQWESWEVGGPVSARVAIHETGHALGLPDYYDYDELIGPGGGLGGLDMMDNNWGDHNCFSKSLLGWLSPRVINQGRHDISLAPSGGMADAVLLMHGDPQSDPYGEYFMVQYRGLDDNDSDYPGPGLLIWHIDARLSEQGNFLYDNSYTDHKLIRLMEADGLEEIEQRLPADFDDFFTPGDLFHGETEPNSHRYDGVPTNLIIDEISGNQNAMHFRADLGSGCALFCEALVPVMAWPGQTTAFEGEAGPSNCQGSASFDWLFGDGAATSDQNGNHTYDLLGSYQWTLQTTLGDASCARQGEILVCEDERCWRWRRGTSMGRERVMHAAVVLADGRVLVAGGEGTPEIYDPAGKQWTRTGPISGTFYSATGALLEDGRVLVVGSTPGDPVNAELYDPVSDTWKVTGQMGRQRTFHSPRRLPDGRVMVAGGYFWDPLGNRQGVLEAEVFDPETETWRGVGTLTSAALLPGLTVLEDGRVLVTGDQSVQIFDPVSGIWTRTADLTFVREYHVAAALDDGRVIVAGGFISPAAEIFDLVTETWSLTSPMTGFRLAPAVWLDHVGRVFLMGGFDRYSNVIDTAEMYDPASGTWTPVASMLHPRLAYGASHLPDGTLLITGGMPTLEIEPYEGRTSVEIFRPPVIVEDPRSPSGRRSIFSKSGRFEPQDQPWKKRRRSSEGATDQ
jgi:M6 family metalloprotease-like protein